MKIAASFLSIQDNMKENIEKLTNTNIDYLHVDIMDGVFVPNKTWNIEEIKKIISLKKPLDVHLMVQDVYKYIDQFSQLKPSFLTFHYEIEHDIMDVVAYIKKLGIPVGISIKPNTRVESIYPFLPFIDLVLIMSVEPGRGGQTFQEQSIDKIEKLSIFREKNHLSYVIEVDGGINDCTIPFVSKADIAVVGSYITNGNYEERISSLKNKVK